MRQYQGIGLAAGMVAWLAATVPTTAQAPASTPGGAAANLRREVAGLRLELLRVEAEAAEIREEHRLVSAALQKDGQADERPLSAKDNVWEDTIRKRIKKGTVAQGPAMNAELEKLQKSLKKDEDEAITAWEEAMEKDLAFQDQIDEAEHLVGWPWKGKRPDIEVSWGLIAQGILALLGGVVLMAHEVRDRLRWRLRALGSRPSPTAFALILPLAAAAALACGAAPGDGTEPETPPAAAAPAGEAGRDPAALERQREELQKRRDATQDALEAARLQLDRHLEEIRHARAASALNPENRDQKELVDRAEAIEKEIQGRFQNLRVSARIAARVVEDTERLETHLKTDTTGLHGFVVGGSGHARKLSLVRLVICGFFILAAIVPLTSIRRRRRAHLNEESLKCPRCLNLGTMDFDTTASDDERGPQAKFRKKVCNVCDYEIRENYIRQNRLCFPTVGIRSSGKTHWMIMLYGMIKNSNIPVASAIRKIPSREDARFDVLLRDLLQKGQKPGATVYSRTSLPYPLTFHVNDADPLGPNKSMVNLFDFSGEMRNFDIDTDEFRRRALLCDGFTLFLDPTQVSEGSEGTIDDQSQTLTQFAEEMHAIRGLASEIPIDLPIAICVSKMDLVVSRNPMGTQAIELVNDLRKTLPQKLDLSLIHERSQLCAAAMPLMFPAWNVERMLRENFGGRYMFFPMSSVGLEEAELGIDDLPDRTITPFGMIEPLLWLLHMHGYCVLH